jgi:SAM-dependent methyltransferase
VGPLTGAAIDRALELFEAAHKPARPDVAHGYLDLLGAEDDPTGGHPAQQLMASRVLPVIYERIWRPLGGRIFMGAMGPGMRGEHRIALEMLDVSEGDKVLDVACGPGNFTRRFSPVAGDDGLAVGLDASATMLARAVREGIPGNVAYVRGDAIALPFRDGVFDAICCFAALYFIEAPMRAIDEMVRVLAPGGRIAIMTSVSRGVLPPRATDAVIRPLTGTRIFGRDEISGALRDRGLTIGEQRVSGLAQFVSARNPWA